MKMHIHSYPCTVYMYALIILELLSVVDFSAFWGHFNTNFGYISPRFFNCVGNLVTNPMFPVVLPLCLCMYMYLLHN